MPFQINEPKNPESGMGKLHKEMAQVYKKIEYYLEILLGDLYGTTPNSIDEYLENNGVTKEQLSGMSFAERLEKAGEVLKGKPTRSEVLMGYLELIFEAKYGWTHEKINSMTFSEVLWCLEASVEDDKMSDAKGIWKITE